MNTADPIFADLDPTAAHVATLREHLATRAVADDTVDVAYRTMDCPLGQLLIAATDVGLVRVAFQWAEPDDVLQELADRVSPRVLRAPRRLDAVARQVDEYFARRRQAFDLPLDMRLAHGFRREVLHELSRIAYGHTASYADVAAGAGRPKAVRAVGTACGMNPLPLVIPCHRVIRSDGSLGEYGGGRQAKRTLLELEGALSPTD